MTAEYDGLVNPESLTLPGQSFSNVKVILIILDI